MWNVNELVYLVFSGLSPLVIEDVTDEGERIAVRARTPEEAVPCPGCGAPSGRVHGFHLRTVADVSVDGRRVVVRVRVRRLVCPTRGCRHTFREQVPGVLERYQRRTARLTRQVKAVVKELAGRAGARLLAILAMRLSRHTALRALLRIPLPIRRVPEALVERRSCADGAKGPRTYDFATVHLADTPHGLAQNLLIRRSTVPNKKNKNGELVREVGYFLCHHAPDATLAELVIAAGQRWMVETFQAAKNEVGFDQHEVRKWCSWYRQTTVCMLALAFLADIRSRRIRPHRATP